MSLSRSLSLAALVATALVALVIALGVRPYGGNLTALLRADRDFAETYRFPPGIVLFEGGYDGMLFYQVARDLPRVIADGADAATGESDRAPIFDESYRYQRVLLPVLALALSGGDESRLPLAMIAVDAASLMAALLLFTAATGGLTVHGLALAANTAALTGLLYCVAEPLSILLATASLLLWRRRGERVTGGVAVLLALAQLARETAMLVALPLAAASLLARRWKDAAYATAALAPAAAWNRFLGLRFGSDPLERSGVSIDFSFAGLRALFADLAGGPSIYGLSAFAFLVAVALPMLLYCARRAREEGMRPGALNLMLGAHLAVLFLLNQYIWDALTGVGRVLPSLYVVYAMMAAPRDGAFERALSLAIAAIGVVGTVGVALIAHSYSVS